MDTEKTLNRQDGQLGRSSDFCPTLEAQRGLYRFHHTDCDWFPMDCYFRWQSGGVDRLTMVDSIAIRKGEKTQKAALRREVIATKQYMKLPPFVSGLLKKISISIKDIKGFT